MRPWIYVFAATLIAGQPAALRAEAASGQAPIVQSDDTWDLDDDRCHGEDAASPSGVDIEFRITNNVSDTPLCENQIQTGGRSGDCHDSAAAPIGWTAAVETDGTIVYTAQSPADYIHAGQTLDGFGMGRHRDRDGCCRRHRAYGPGAVGIQDDDDGRDHCFSTHVSTAPATWGGAKQLFQ